MDELWLIAALVLALAVRTWVAELIRVKGKSMAIEELAATWDTSFDAEEKEDHEEGQS